VRFEDLPKIDLVVISHNHYDHMDLPTLKRLWERDRPDHRHQPRQRHDPQGEGISAIALDWGAGYSVAPLCPPANPCGAIDVRVERNHHWGSRWGTDRNRRLWSAFTVKLPGGNLFFAGDTGYGDGSWAAEAARNGPFRLAILPVGAYAPRDVMKGNHMDPDEAVRVFETLKPAMALGMHWGTFQLTFESIDDPPRRLAAARKARGIPAERFVTTEVGRSFRVP
jgi:L-ascorbate metabolism protein UlaG (beta-lactamase superfamily)